ncbi:DUF6481 family protein [Jiella pacifica]|uniref:Uncharacterized protein n=1 Tax=Jiella pacifica TaxID=2696469 RepID=A0A6N9TAX6_9HYPH|nr:DUF6481 family protein [Jiella pacifica]NDW06048.1 hypothetical protein [Jiella pacifica]
MKSKDADFVERRAAAKDAKAALLEKVKAKQNDPAAEARRAERAAVVAAREEREAAKRAEAEKLARENAEREAAEQAAKQAEENKLINRMVEDEAARKAARDERYAARKARKGHG